MKAKLLKLLRKQANRDFKIKGYTNKFIFNGKTFYEISYYCLCRNIPFTSWHYLKHAESTIKESKRKYILFRIRELRKQKEIKNILQ